MYAINYIQKPVLITASECQYKFGNAIPVEKWNAAIETAEIRFIQPILGYDFYNALCTAKNILVTSGNINQYQALINTQFPPAGTVVLVPGQYVNAIELSTMTQAYKDLWDNVLWAYLYQCVFLIALPKNYADFSAAGVVKNNPIGSVLGDTHSNSVGVSLNDIKWLEDRLLLDNINPLQTELERYLCLNKGNYPLYDSACNCENFDYKKKENGKRTTSFIDIYPDDDCDNDRRSTSSWGRD